MGFNSTQVGDGNITNIVIKSRYALLDLKSDKLEIRLKKFLRQMLKVVLDEINRELQTNYKMKDVQIVLEREVITNAKDNAEIELLNAQRKNQETNTLLSAASAFDDDTILKALCEILDLDYDEVKSRIEEQKEQNPEKQIQDVKSALNQLSPDEEAAGE